MIQKHIHKACIFVISFLLMVIGIFIIKNREQTKTVSKVETETNLEPIDPAILGSQGEIQNDREQKLRKQNTAPKETKQVNTSTTTTTKTPQASSKKSSSSTKTS
jgi:hypothetical protein